MNNFFSKYTYIFIFLILVAWIIKYVYQLPKFSSGEPSKDFSAVLISGDNFDFKELRDNYVLLDFWGSWCGPCRAENPKLVSLHNQFKNKSFHSAEGFEIVSIALENKRNQWENAIVKDRLDWIYHIIEIEKFKGPIAKLYGVKQIPTKYFIGPDGKIISVNAEIDTIEAFLSKNIRE